MRLKQTKASAGLAALLLSGAIAVSPVAGADWPVVPALSLASPVNPEDPSVHLTLTAVPGGYALWASTDLTGLWTHETNIVVGPGGTADVTVERNDRSVLLLRAGATDAVSLLTLGSTIEPQVFCDGTAPEAFSWNWEDGTTASDLPLAFKDFGIPAARLQRLTVAPADVITRINLGFDGADGGGLTPLPLRPPQNVAAVWFPTPLTNLTCWASSYNPITNSLDFSGFTGLEYVECYQCPDLQQVVATNLPSLKRLCLEDCDLRELDLSGNPNLEDLRGALNSLTNIVVGRGTGPRIWHWCTRDNPLLTQQFADIMTNFHSLRELYIWNDNQAGALAVGSTNLTDVRAFNNHFTAADFTGQSNLWRLSLRENELTNLVLTGCTSLMYLDAGANRLPTAVLDTVLATLDASAPWLKSVDLSVNAQPPSATGYTHYTNLVNRGVTVNLDWPGDNDGSNNVPGGVDAITFVTSSRNPHMEIQTGAGTATNILWHWGDGAIQTADLTASHDFGSPGLRTNYIQVLPPTSVTYFGAPQGTTDQGIRAVHGAANFPNLSFLYLYREELTDLSIAGCASLRQLHLAANPVPTNVCDQWFLDLDSTVTGPVTGADFWYPASQRSAASDAAWGSLVSKGYVMHPYWPDGNDGSNNVPGGIDAITFVTSSRYPHMEIQTGAGPATNILWHWGDGTVQTADPMASHDFGSPGLRTNYIQVLPPTSVTYFGAPRGTTDQGIQCVYGAANFPNLSFLYLYQEELTDLSIAGCASLRQLHLADNPVPTTVCDQWFLDLDSAVTGPVTGADFWYPASQRSAASDAAWASLVSKGYVMHPD